jgi:hypothetical protein
LILKQFLSLKISNIFQKFRLWKEKSVEDMVTLEGFTIQIQAWFPFIFGLFEKLIHTLHAP